MDSLKDKSYKNYSYISRYSQFPYFYNTLDNKYIYGRTSYLLTDIVYTLVRTTPTDTLTILSNKYYGRPDYYWVIADFNRIIDPFETLPKTIKIPDISQIVFAK